MDLCYTDEPFSIRKEDALLWRILYWRHLGSRTIFSPSVPALKTKEKITLTYEKQLNNFLCFSPLLEKIKTHELGLTVLHPSLVYTVTLNFQRPIKDFTLYHGTKKLQLCLTNDGLPVKYCGLLRRLKFVVTGYIHLYLYTHAKLKQGDVQCTITISKPKNKQHTKAIYRTENNERRLLYASKLVDDHYIPICNAAVEKMYRAYVQALKTEEIDFPFSSEKRSNYRLFFRNTYRTKGGSLFQAIFLTEKKECDWLVIPPGKRLLFQLTGFSVTNALCQIYGTQNELLVCWPCSRTHIHFLFEYTEAIHVQIRCEEHIEEINVLDAQLVVH